MSITKNICASIISLLGNLIFIITICYMLLSSLVYPDYLLDGITFRILCACIDYYIYIIPCLFILGPIEDILANKVLHKENFLNFQIKNEYLKYTYNILFWFGFICSSLYLILYICNL